MLSFIAIMILQHLYLLLGWALFGFLHSALCSKKVKKYFLKENRLTAKNYKLLYVLFAVFSLIAVIWLGIYISTKNIFEPSLYSKIVATIFLIPGGILMLICAVNYGKSILSRTNNDNAKLHTDGLYAIVRHPLYLATFLFVIGIVIYLPTYSNLIAAGCIITYTCVAIPLEEEKLIESFGEDYLSYKIRTAAIIPFVRPKK